MDIEKLYQKFNKKWIGTLYAFAIFLIFTSFGAIIGYALGKNSEGYIYTFIWILIIGYCIALPIGFIQAHLKKNYKEIRKIKIELKCQICGDFHYKDIKEEEPFLTPLCKKCDSRIGIIKVIK